MRRSAFLTGLAVFALATPALASTPDADFRALCLRPKGDLVATKVVARLGNWGDAIGSGTAGRIAMVKVTKAWAWVRASRTLRVGDGTVSLDGKVIAARACSLSDPSGGAGSLAAARVAIAKPPIRQSAAGSVYMLDARTGAALSQDPPVQSFARGQVAMVLLGGQGPRAEFVYVIGRPAV
jgi:hypothetical protein